MSGIDRRTKERISSEQTATIYLQSGEASPCVIADFCDTGMLITFKPSSIRFDTTQRIIRVSFRDEAGRELFVNAEPVYVNDHESGIRFVNKYTHVVDYLRGRFQKVPAPKVASEHEHLVEQCLVITHRYANDLFQELSPKLVETFREEALASTSDQLSNARMAIAVRFEKHADTIRSKFLTEVMRPESLARLTTYKYQVFWLCSAPRQNSYRGFNFAITHNQQHCATCAPIYCRSLFSWLNRL